MENIIKHVIETEYKAQKIIDEVQDERKQAEDHVEKQIQKIKERIMLSTKQKLEKIKAEKLEQAGMQAESVTSEANERALMMRNTFEKNRKLWAEHLLNNVLERGR